METVLLSREVGIFRSFFSMEMSFYSGQTHRKAAKASSVAIDGYLQDLCQ